LTSDFFQRIRKELSIDLDTVREIVLGLSERVNRKVQIVKLHWRAASLSEQQDTVLQELGGYLATFFAHTDGLSARFSDREGTAARIEDTASRVRMLKKELAQIGALVRELETDTLREDLLKIQQDLTLRAAAFERFSVAQGSPVVGLPVSQLALPPATRVVAILRGPSFLAVNQQAVLHAGDIVILVGPRAELKAAVSQFVVPQRASA